MQFHDAAALMDCLKIESKAEELLSFHQRKAKLCLAVVN
jgi:hypothetical protein